MRVMIATYLKPVRNSLRKSELKAITINHAGYE